MPCRSPAHFSAVAIAAVAVLLPLSPLQAQEPTVRISHIEAGSLGVELTEPGYLLVLEYPAGERSRLLHPAEGEEWVLSPAGAVEIPIAASALAAERDGDAIVEPQCIVGPRDVTRWSPGEGLSRRGVTAACGPVPRSGARPSPRPGVPSVHFGYEPTSTRRGYIMVMRVSADERPVSVWSGETTVRAPVERARNVGSWAVGRGGDHTWEAAVWMPAQGRGNQ